MKWRSRRYGPDAPLLANLSGGRVSGDFLSGRHSREKDPFKVIVNNFSNRFKHGKLSIRGATYGY